MSCQVMNCKYNEESECTVDVEISETGYCLVKTIDYNRCEQCGAEFIHNQQSSEAWGRIVYEDIYECPNGCM